MRANWSACAQSEWRLLKCLQLARLQPFAGQFAHLDQEPQVPALRGRLRIGTLEDLDDPFHHAVAGQRSQDQQVAGRDCRPHLPPRRPTWAAPAAVPRLWTMWLSNRRWRFASSTGRQQRLAQIDLVGQLRTVPFAHQPHGATHSGQGRHDALHERGVVLLRVHIALGQLSDFAHQTADLLFGLFDRLGIHGWLSDAMDRSPGRIGSRSGHPVYDSNSSAESIMPTVRAGIATSGCTMH